MEISQWKWNHREDQHYFQPMEMDSFADQIEMIFSGRRPANENQPMKVDSSGR